MKLTPVDTLPESLRRYHCLQDMIEEFVRSEAEVVRVDLGENDYKSPKVAASSIRVAAKRSRRNVKVALRDGKIFLFRG